jgi:hypothetical protein
MVKKYIVSILLIQLFFLVIATIACEYNNGKVDNTPPIIIDGTLTLANYEIPTMCCFSADLTWTKAKDNFSDQEDLLYAAYYNLPTIEFIHDDEGIIIGSEINEKPLDTIENIESNGILFFGYDTDISSCGIGGSRTQYYLYNVIVMDEAGNKSAYNQRRIGYRID